MILETRHHQKEEPQEYMEQAVDPRTSFDSFNLLVDKHFITFNLRVTIILDRGKNTIQKNKNDKACHEI